MRFLQEQFFPQTLPSIIYMQPPLDIATLLDAADYLVSGQGYKTCFSRFSELRSGSGISCDEQTFGAAGVLQEGWSSARPCRTTISQRGRADYDTAVLSLELRDGSGSPAQT